MSKPLILLKNLCMSFGGGEEVLKSINMSINDKEFLTLLGPSGCGKTTTLRLIGGFEKPTSGDVYFNNVRINDLPPYKRAVNTVFQRYALFPHLDVYENIAFGLRIQHSDEKEIRRRVSEMLHLVNLSGYEKRDVTVLSGGQQQRVAVARALINEPRVLLLDEPLGALDMKLRKEMQIELKRIQQQLGITFVYVTHDQEEALTMSDTVAVMKDGVIQQIGSPEDVYNEPINSFVADFIGQSNIVPGVMVRDFLVDFGGARFECVDKGFGENEPVEVVIRPEDLKIVPPENARMTGVVESAIFKGVHYEMMLGSGEIRWMVHSTLYEEPGNLVGLHLLPMDIHIMHSSPAVSKDNENEK